MGLAKLSASLAALPHMFPLTYCCMLKGLNDLAEMALTSPAHRTRNTRGASAKRRSELAVLQLYGSLNPVCEALVAIVQ
jgi:hypothetical protein